jgi:hypothetical protein
MVKIYNGVGDGSGDSNIGGDDGDSSNGNNCDSCDD